MGSFKNKSLVVTNFVEISILCDLGGKAEEILDFAKFLADGKFGQKRCPDFPKLHFVFIISLFLCLCLFHPR